MLFEQRREEELCKLQSDRSSASTKKIRKKSKKSMLTVVQKLYETCKEVFAGGSAGIVPSAENIEKLRLVLDTMKPEDVGLTQDMPFFKRIENELDGVPPITYLHVFECKRFSIGIFCLPPSGVIPLHNHPGMTVFSKLIFGSMHIKSYDWVMDAPHNTKENLNSSQIIAVQPPGTRLAKVNTDAVFTAPCNSNILYPAAGGNMHCFTAVTACAVLDVLGPPYNDREGRSCMYYRNVPSTIIPGDVVAMTEREKNGWLEERENPGGASEREEYAWLEEREKPENFFVIGALYKGPRVMMD